ncbi:chemotaxis protein CheW [Sphingomonas sp. RS2018]
MTEGLYLVAHVAGRTVAIDCNQVDSVVDITQITPVPRVAPSVRGLAALRSRVVTVIDTRQALNLPGRSKSGRSVIVRQDGHLYAMLVDALDDVAPFAMQPLASGIALSPTWRGIARGLIERDGEPVLVIDLCGLVPHSQDIAA